MKALILAAALAVAAPAVAAETELPVEVPEGATWTVETLRVRTSTRDGKPEETRSVSRYQATYRSLKGGGALLTLRSLDGSPFGAVPGVSLAEFDRPLELEVDETLAPVRLRNWTDYRRALFRMVEAGEGGKPPDPKALQAMKDLFGGIPDDRAHQIMAPAFNYVGLGQGLALEAGKPREFESEQPSPLGGTIKTRGSYLLEAVDQGAGRAVVVWTQALDPESMRAAVRGLLERMAKALAKPEDIANVDALMEKASLRRDDRCRFEIHVPTGLATKTECSTTIALAVPGEAPLNRSDRWTITQSVPEAPR